MTQEKLCDVCGERHNRNRPCRWERLDELAQAQSVESTDEPVNNPQLTRHETVNSAANKADRDRRASQFVNNPANRHKVRIAELEALLTERDAKIADLETRLAERDDEIARLKQPTDRKAYMRDYMAKRRQQMKTHA